MAQTWDATVPSAAKNRVGQVASDTKQAQLKVRSGD